MLDHYYYHSRTNSWAGFAPDFRHSKKPEFNPFHMLDTVIFYIISFRIFDCIHQSLNENKSIIQNNWSLLAYFFPDKQPL